MAREASIVLTSATLQTAFAEAYRSLRANLGVDGGMQGARALLVASGGPGEGKSTTVANLGILMAQAGQRVVLVDADFRRPCLHRLLAASGNGHRVTGVDGFWQRDGADPVRSEEHTSELQSPCNLVCRLLLEKKKHMISHEARRNTLQGITACTVDVLPANNI